MDSFTPGYAKHDHYARAEGDLRSNAECRVIEIKDDESARHDPEPRINLLYLEIA